MATFNETVGSHVLGAAAPGVGAECGSMARGLNPSVAVLLAGLAVGVGLASCTSAASCPQVGERRCTGATVESCTCSFGVGVVCAVSRWTASTTCDEARPNCVLVSGQYATCTSEALGRCPPNAEVARCVDEETGEECITAATTVRGPQTVLSRHRCPEGTRCQLRPDGRAVECKRR